MALGTYKSGDTQIWFKVMRGKAHFAFRGSRDQEFNLGIAFRTYDAPIGYFPFYGTNDFDFSGETSFKEQVIARLPMDLSAPASPHSLLILAAAGDPDFLGSGDGDAIDIQQAVKKDAVSHAMRCASGVFVDGVMMALGGPTIKTLVNQLVKSKARQFLLSRAISGAAKSHLKSQGNFNVDKILSGVP